MKTHNKAPKPFWLLTKSANSTKGWLKNADRLYACQLGRSGCSAMKREGDGATPIGSWPLRQVFYRADRVARPKTPLPVKIIQRSDGWCDDPHDRNYNRPVALPYPASAENLWRADHAYDLVVVLDYNLQKRAINRGSGYKLVP